MTDKQKKFFEAVNKWFSKMGEEAQIQKEFVSWFRKFYPNSVIFHIPNGIDCKNGVDRYVRKCLGVEAGIPDIQIIHKNKVFFIEFKAPKGEISPIQKHTIAHIETAGIPVFVCYSFMEAVKIIYDI